MNDILAGPAAVRIEDTLFWIHAASDLTIAAAYVGISATLGWLYVRLRRQLPFRWVVAAFGLFIVACGGSHLMHVLVSAGLPVTGFAALVQGLTVGASVATAVALPPLVPKIIAMFDSARVSESRKQQLDATQSEKLRALGQLAGGVAHDLNQSLGIIAGYSDLAVRELSQTQPNVGTVREHLSLVSQAAQDGGVTVRRLLTFARGGADGEAESIDVGELLAEVARLTAPRWRDQANADGQRVDLIVESIGAASIRGWASTLREALINLVLNALDAMPAGGMVTLGAERSGGDVVITVRDTGVGIPEQVQGRIFEPFFTTKGERGTGLGLAMVHSIVERHGGEIEVESEPGAGTTFSIRFPAAEAASQPAPREVHSETTPPLRILAVDDEAPLVRLIAVLLRPHGHEVTTASSGEEALAILRERPFDLVISDLGMAPGMNGWELAALVGEQTPAPTFVLATGWGAEIDPAEARRRGVHAVLAKPFRSRQLEQALAGLHAEGRFTHLEQARPGAARLPA